MRPLLSRIARRWPWLAAILTLGVVLRLGVVIAFPSVFAFDQTGAIQGSEAYDTYAQNLIKTGVFGRIPGTPDAAIPPLYPYVLAAVYAIFGRGTLQVVLFHTLLDVASMGMLYQIGLRLFRFGGQPPTLARAVGLIATLCYALYPYLIFQNMTLIDTPLFMTLLHAFTLCMIILRERDQASWRGTLLIAALGGVLLGASMLVRPIMPIYAALIGLWFLFRLKLAPTLFRLLPVAAVSLVLMVPWTLRNEAVYQAFVPMTVTSGSNFWQGNNAWTIPFFRAGYDVQWVPAPVIGDPAGPPLDARAQDAEFLRLAFAYWREHPDQIPTLLWTKFLVHWSIDIMPSRNPIAGKVPPLDYQGNVVPETGPGGLNLSGVPANDPVTLYAQPLFDQIGRAVHRLYYGGLFLLAIAGVLLTLRRWRDVALVWFVQISMTMMYVTFHPSTRYRVPTDPLLFLFSAYMLALLIKRVKPLLLH